MSGALLDDLLAGYIAPACTAFAALTPAKAANSAKSEHPCGPAPALAPCEGLRLPAKPAAVDADSQTFAGIRKPRTRPQSEQACGSSQDSQDSQGFPLQCAKVSDADLSAVAWTDDDIATLHDRRARLLHWGWPESEADALAERLARRDREQDERVSCTDCCHFQPGRCGSHRAALLHSHEVGRDLAAMLQRCPGFKP